MLVLLQEIHNSTEGRGTIGVKRSIGSTFHGVMVFMLGDPLIEYRSKRSCSHTHTKACNHAPSQVVAPSSALAPRGQGAGFAESRVSAGQRQCQQWSVCDCKSKAGLYVHRASCNHAAGFGLPERSPTGVTRGAMPPWIEQKGFPIESRKKGNK
eukprot:1136681-Pelagomonas_calceolata.AAC.5